MFIWISQGMLIFRIQTIAKLRIKDQQALEVHKLLGHLLVSKIGT